MRRTAKLFYAGVLVFAASAADMVTHPAEAEVLFKQKFEYFTVRGKSSLQIFREFQKKSPIKAKGEDNAILGVAAIKLVPEIQYLKRGERCKVGTATVTADVVIHLPRWANYKRADADAKERWDKFVVDIKTHELMHAEIAREYAGRIKTKLESFLPRSNCEILEKALTNAATALLKKHDRAQRKFDEKEYRRLFRR